MQGMIYWHQKIHIMSYIMVMDFRMLKYHQQHQMPKNLGKTSIPRISQYHSFEFISDLTVMWRQFGIGLGKIWNYTEVKFQPAIHIVLPFSASTKNNQVDSKSKWSCLGRSINTVMSCTVLILVLRSFCFLIRIYLKSTNLFLVLQEILIDQTI